MFAHSMITISYDEDYEKRRVLLLVECYCGWKHKIEIDKVDLITMSSDFIAAAQNAADVHISEYAPDTGFYDTLNAESPRPDPDDILKKILKSRQEDKRDLMFSILVPDRRKKH